jgi:hypothetical protein
LRRPTELLDGIDIGMARDALSAETSSMAKFLRRGGDQGAAPGANSDSGGAAGTRVPAMGPSSPPRLLALHGLRLKGFAEAGTVAEGAGLTEAEVEAELRALADEGLVKRREGRVSGWSLTPAGRSEHARLVADELEAAGARGLVRDAYRRFLALNPELLAVCTAWQLRTTDGSQVVNDHSDPAYDEEVVGRLVAVDEGVRPIVADLAARLGRFEPYGGRLRRARERVAAGEHEWLTKPVIDSYHTVWFELHEDLLCSLGLERAAEAGA